MNKQTQTTILFAATMILSLPAFAGKKVHGDIAKVTHVEPIYEQIERRVPQERCWIESIQERQPERRNSSTNTPTLIGGIIGGVIGNELGRGGDNKKIGAVVGTLLGASIGKDIERKHRRNNDTYNARRHTQYRDVERCEISHSITTEQVLQGYNVDYRYAGRTYSTVMEQHPGEKIRVAVDVRPLRN